jgi:hypothetical protein
MARATWIEQRTLKELTWLPFGGAIFAALSGPVLPIIPKLHVLPGFLGHFRPAITLLCVCLVFWGGGAWIVRYIVAALKRRVAELEWNDARLASLKGMFVRADRPIFIAFVLVYIASEFVRHYHFAKPYTVSSWCVAVVCLFLTHAVVLRSLKKPTRTIPDVPSKPRERWKPIVSERWGERKPSE